MTFADDLLFSLVRIVLITACTLGMMSTLTTFKYRAKTVFLIFCIYLLWVTASTAIILYFLGYHGIIRVFLFTIVVPAVYLTYRMDRNAPIQSVFNYATQILFSIILIPVGIVLNASISGNQFTYILIRVVIYALVIYLEYHFLRRPFHQLFHVIQTGRGIRSLIPLSFCLLLGLVSSIRVYYLQHPVSVLYIMGIVITMFVVYFAVCWSLTGQYHLQMLAHDREVLWMQISAMNKRADVVLAAEEKLRILRHDVRHFTELIQSNMQQGAPLQAAYVLSTFEAAVHNTSVNCYCNHYIINSILVSYFEQAETEEIVVKTRFIAPPDDKVNAITFSVMLANALENALNACKQENGRPVIELKSRIFNGQYLMELSNTCSKPVLFDKTGLPLSSKGEGHGIGTRSILAFAKEQDATVIFREEKERFILQMILGLEKSK